MADWWNNLTLLKQIFYTVAIPATLVLVIQSIMAMIGLSDFSTDTDGLDINGFDDPDGFDGIDSSQDIEMHDQAGNDLSGVFKFFTIRGLVAFFSIFGWTGVVLAEAVHPAIAIFVALLSGLLAMMVIGYLFYLMTALQYSGNIHYDNCIGKTGEVYLTIPPKNQGRGKVTLTVQERLIEVNAITEDELPIKSGDTITVIGMMSDHTAIVKRV